MCDEEIAIYTVAFVVLPPGECQGSFFEQAKAVSLQILPSLTN
jgi:hypothetical protein